MTENILHHFFDFNKLINATAFGNGHINDTYKIELKINNRIEIYLLQRLNHQVFSEPFLVMENIQQVADHLSKKKYQLKILSPILTLKKQLLYKDSGGNYWRVFNFIKNTIAVEKAETPEQAYEAAKAFGAFAKALDDIDISLLKTTIPGFHDGEKRMADFMLALKNAPSKKIAAAKKEIAGVLQQKAIFKHIAALKLPLRAIHHDTKINNLLFDKTTMKAAAVVDLDTVMPGIVLSDFGDMVRTFASTADEEERDFTKVEIRADIYGALTEGFLSEMGNLLTDAERRSLHEGGPWITLMQAVRFLSDYLKGDVYYKTKYPDHNLHRAGKQLALLRSMQQQTFSRR